MADRDREGRHEGADDSSSTRGEEPHRGEFGDDQGTRVGSPTPSGREDGNPSTRPVKEGLEGAIMDDDQEQGRTAGNPTGAGAEGARGIHGQGSGDETAKAGGRTSEQADGTERAGSEPIRGRQREHVSGYGGAGDKPKTSSDQREPLDPEGGAEIE